MSKYLIVFFVSMVPILELRFAMPIAVGMDLPYLPALITCVIGNMVPEPFIYMFARKFLIWGSHKKYIHKICTFFLEKGEKAGQKLVSAAGRGGLFVALMLFVGIPIPGTGAWTASLIATLMQLRVVKSTFAILLGVITCGIIMGILSFGIVDFIM